MTARDRVAALLGGLAAGAAGGLFGIGGGVLLVPVLTGLLRRNQHEAHGTSLAVIGATAVAGIAVYGAHQRVDWVTGLIAGVASLVTARLGARLAARMPTRNLKLGFSVMMVVVAIRLLWKTHPGVAAFSQLSLPARIVFDLFLGSGVGLLAGIMGVGGGLIAVPAFTLLLGMPQQLAQGTSLAVILLAAPAGAVEHARHGNVVVPIALWLAAGAITGGLVASVFVQSVPGPLVTRGFAIFLLANALPMAYRALRLPATAIPGPR